MEKKILNLFLAIAIVAMGNVVGEGASCSIAGNTTQKDPFNCNCRYNKIQDREGSNRKSELA